MVSVVGPLEEPVMLPPTLSGLAGAALLVQTWLPESVKATPLPNDSAPAPLLTVRPAVPRLIVPLPLNV